MNLKQFAILLLILLSCKEQKSDTTSISGEIEDFQNQTIYFQHLTQPPFNKLVKYKAVINNDGKFTISLPFESIQFGELIINNNIYTTSIEKGDNIKIKLLNNIISYSGYGSNKNNFLFKLNVLELGSNQFDTLSNNKNNFSAYTFEHKLKRLRDERESLVLLEKKISPIFRKEFLIKNRLLFDYHLFKLSNRRHFQNIWKKEDLPIRFSEIAQLNNYINDSLVKYQEYFNTIKNVINSRKSKKMISLYLYKKNPNDREKMINDYCKSLYFDSLKGETQAHQIYSKTIESFKNGIVDSLYLNYIVKSQFEYLKLELNKELNSIVTTNQLSKITTNQTDNGKS
jgi:hypothetical protein